MKAIQMFFEMLVKYQRIKYELRINFEKFKAETRIMYAERMKEINSK